MIVAVIVVCHIITLQYHKAAFRNAIKPLMPFDVFNTGIDNGIKLCGTISEGIGIVTDRFKLPRLPYPCFVIQISVFTCRRINVNTSKFLYVDI
jgi:hypothetical protein